MGTASRFRVLRRRRSRQAPCCARDSRQVDGRSVPGGFVYQHLGSLATIGRKAAVVDFGHSVVRRDGVVVLGRVHLGFLVDVRNRVSVMFDWFWAYLTYRSGTRLITGGGAPEPAAQPASAVRVATAMR